MGGDKAPREVVRGAVEVARDHPQDLRIALVGQAPRVEAELKEAGWDGSNIDVIHAEHVIEMGDSPVVALRKKKGSSVEVAVRRVREGNAVAMVSAGNTGACVAGATLLLGLLPEVRRAGIAVTLSAGNRPIVICDVGANIASKPEHLLQYGFMASLYSREVLGVTDPRVGLLNIGEENEKGTSVTKATNTTFSQADLNFVGNVEGGDIFRGTCDVAICDGFVGNIVLKTSEGLAEQLVDLFRRTVEEALGAVEEKLRGSTGAAQSAGGQPAAGPETLFREVIGTLRGKVDYSEYGGAPLLGVNGVVIIAHGRSDAKAIANAIRVSKRMAETDVNRRITDEIRTFSGQKEAS